MASVSDILGVQWQGDGENDGPITLHHHARTQALAKGINPAHVLRAANDPQHTYENRKYPGQMRHIRHGIVAVVDPVKKQVVTVYKDQEVTAQRPDQKNLGGSFGGTSWLQQQAAKRTVGGRA